MTLSGIQHRRKNAPCRARAFLRALRFEPLEDRLPLATINLGAINARVFGAELDDESGIAVSGAGDVNGDGFDDVVIGARFGDAANNAKNAAGDSYLIFGRPTFGAIDLANLGSAGVTLHGADVFDYSGRAVNSAGDVNGDGFDDFLIGAVEADAANNSISKAGDTYLIFGRPDWSNIPVIDLGSLGNLGVTFFGADLNDYSGRAVSSAGDVNGDGFDDLIIGAHYGDGPSNLRIGSGETALIFGKANWSTTPTIDLGNLGPSGATIFGVNNSDDSGLAVGSAGDVNGDGFDDLLIGARFGDAANNAKNAAGDSYIVFGKANWSATLTLDLANLGTAGVVLFGADVDDLSGISLSGAGDVNGDGFDDVLIGAVGGDGLNDTGNNAGESYIVFGKANWAATPTIDLGNLGNAGVTFLGVDDLDNSGFEVNGAGDMNGDGFDDLVIGAGYADGETDNKTNAGETYVVFGRASWLQNFFLETLNNGGITIFGADAQDFSGLAADGAGDINGDGFDDLILGAYGADALNNAKLDAGESYLIFGTNQFTSSVTHLGTEASETLTGSSNANIMVGHRGNDTLIGLGGADVLRGGQGNDILAVSNLSYQRIVGGNGTDMLRLDGSGLVLDLTARPDNRILGIEQIQITGTGANTLTLNPLEVLNISNESNTLVVFRDSDDTVNRGLGWTQQLDETINGVVFEVFTQGAAILKIQKILNADIGIAKSASPTSVLAGGSSVFTIQVSNTGPATASGVTVTDTLPSGLSFNPATSSGNCSAIGVTVTCLLDDIPSGSNGSVLIGVRVASTVAQGAVITNTATVTATQSDPTPENRTASASLTVDREADLLVTKTPSADPVAAGSTFKYAIKIENRGPSDASNVILTDTLPDGLTFSSTVSSPGCSATGQVVTCNVGAIGSGSTTTPQIGVIVSESLSAGTVLSNTASVTSNEPDPTPNDRSSTSTVTVNLLTNLAVTKTASQNPVPAGGTFQYVVEVANAGPSNASGIVVDDTLPIGLTFVSATSSGACVGLGRDVTCTIGNLNVNGTRTLTIAVSVASNLTNGTVLSNTATVSGNETDTNPNDQSSTVNVTVGVNQDPSPWQNTSNRLDVNNDNFVSPIDVLQIINELNLPRFSGLGGRLPVPPPPGPRPFLDVNGDNFVVPNDALTVINFLNSGSGGEGEGNVPRVKALENESLPRRPESAPRTRTMAFVIPQGDRRALENAATRTRTGDSGVATLKRDWFAGGITKTAARQVSQTATSMGRLSNEVQSQWTIDKLAAGEMEDALTLIAEDIQSAWNA